jgi:hypothetical protein
LAAGRIARRFNVADLFPLFHVNPADQAAQNTASISILPSGSLVIIADIDRRLIAA